jgi:hypothetical protein
MPYIITTRQVAKPPNERLAVSTLIHSRRAVATLEEARERAYIEMAERGHAIDNVVPPIIDESGGTIGPLPDGTVIEVERVKYREAWKRLAA